MDTTFATGTFIDEDGAHRSFHAARSKLTIDACDWPAPFSLQLCDISESLGSKSRSLSGA
jgi:hypothetical protein